MSGEEVRLDLLLGRRVLSKTGKYVGRIEEICAEKQGQDWVVTSYRTGDRAFFERLAASATLRPVARVLHLDRPKTSRHLINWDQLDIADPETPRLTCALNELTRIGTGSPEPPGS